jgi:hypothetical protein
MLQPRHLTAETSIADGFALMLETACRDFEALGALLRKDIEVSGDPRTVMRAAAAIRMALAKSFVFHLVRAARICEHGAQSINVEADERKTFLRAMKPLLLVRDVNEHGFDSGSGSRGKKSKPSIHLHEIDEVALDETALAFAGPERVLMGPVNLFDFYPPANRIRSIAGFSRVRAIYSAPKT